MNGRLRLAPHENLPNVMECGGCFSLLSESSKPFQHEFIKAKRIMNKSDELIELGDGTGELEDWSQADRK